MWRPATWLALAEVGHALSGEVRAVVVRVHGGAGRTEDASAVGAELLALGDDGVGWLREARLTSVAAVGGVAMGPAFELALACDLRILADDAQLAITATGDGLVPAHGAAAALVALVGPARALELCLTGRVLGAAQAAGLGLAELVVAPAALDSAVDDLVAAILAAPRDAVIETKALLGAGQRHAHAEQLVAERAALARRLANLSGAPE